jgi:DnaK suppressor protein
MDADRARALLEEERSRVEKLLAGLRSSRGEDRSSADESPGWSDPATSIAAEGADDAVASSLQERLRAIERAEKRLEAGTYGLSVRSGQPIPDPRLEADPAAELTVEEAAG